VVEELLASAEEVAGVEAAAADEAGALGVAEAVGAGKEVHCIVKELTASMGSMLEDVRMNWVC
jgi:hypothetical protein